MDERANFRLTIQKSLPREKKVVRSGRRLDAMPFTLASVQFLFWYWFVNVSTLKIFQQQIQKYLNIGSMAVRND